MNLGNEYGGDIGLVTIACNGIGYALKKSPVPNWIIPFALPVSGAVLYSLLTDCSLRSGLLGSALGFTAVGVNQASKQLSPSPTHETLP